MLIGDGPAEECEWHCKVRVGRKSGIKGRADRYIIVVADGYRYGLSKRGYLASISQLGREVSGESVDGRSCRGCGINGAGSRHRIKCLDEVGAVRPDPYPEIARNGDTSGDHVELNSRDQCCRGNRKIIHINVERVIDRSAAGVGAITVVAVQRGGF